MDELMYLKQYGAYIKRDRFDKKAYIIKFPFEEATTTIRIVFEDYSGADLVITNMTTLPEDKTRHGFGSRALQSLLLWAYDSKLENIIAVQVQKNSESFWLKNHFERCKYPNLCNDFFYKNNKNF